MIASQPQPSSNLEKHEDVLLTSLGGYTQHAEGPHREAADGERRRESRPEILTLLGPRVVCLGFHRFPL